MTDARTYLAGIKERAEKATTGPWVAWDRGIGYEVHHLEDVPLNSGHRETFTKPDAAFISSARTDLPRVADALLAVLDLHEFAHVDVEPWALGYRYSGDHCAFDGAHWPCPTVAAITEALEASL